MPIKRLPKKLVDSISTNLDTLFDRVKAQALGPGHVQDKRLAIGFDRWLSLPGVYEQAAKEEGSEPDHDLLDSALRTAANYIDATKEKAKARVVNEINAHLRAGTIGNDKPEEFEDKLRDSLQNIWTDVTEQVHRIIDSEASHVKNLGLLDGIQQVNAERGIEDPSVFFVTARENVCDECLRLHTVDGGKPRVWKLSEIGHDYHKRGDPEPKLNGLHPHCFTGSMRLHTNLGLLTARELFDLATPVSAVVDGRVLNRRQGNNQYGDEIPGSVWYHRHRSGARLRAATHVYDTGVQRCIRITLDSGHQLEVSLGHEMWIDDGTVGKKIRADALQIGDKVPLLSGIGAFGTDHFPLEAELMGSILGDGTLGIDTAQFHFFGTDIPYGVSLAEAASQVTGQAYCARVQPPDAKYNVPRMIFNSTVLRRSFVHDFGLSKTPRRVPKRMWSADQETTAAFLRGLYAADGHSEDTPSVVLAQNDLEFLREIQVLLANLGLRSRIYTHGTDEVLKTITYADGRQFDTVRKPAWRLHIGGVDQVRYFAKVIGFGVPAKQTALNARLAQVKGKALHGSWRTAHVLMIEELGEQQTYCLTEPMTNTVTVNGIVTGNCRCTIATLLPGFGFNGAGKVTYVDRDHDEYAAQHGLKKSESSAETKRLVRRWTKEGSVSVRDRLPKMTGEHRTHALESLRRNARLVEGKKLLLFRGMGSEELEAAMDGDCLVYDTRTSWTPYRKQADGFALEYKGKSVSAWIPESAVVTVPNEYRAAEYTLEHEVVVAPGEYEFREILEPKKLAKNDSDSGTKTKLSCDPIRPCMTGTDGSPLVVYHGTPHEPFSKFAVRGGLGGALGFWFASKLESTAPFSRWRYAGEQPHVASAHLRARNLKEYNGWSDFVANVHDFRKKTPEDGMRALRRSLMRLGHDAVVIRNSDTDNGGVRDDYVVFHPHQVHIVGWQPVAQDLTKAITSPVKKSEQQPGASRGTPEMAMRTRPTYSQKWAYRGMDVPAHRAVQALGKIVPRPAHDLDGESVTFFTHDPQGARYYAGENKRRKHPGHVYRFPWPKDAMAHNQGWDEEPSGEWHTRQPIPLEHAQVYVGQPGQESEDDALWRPAKEMKKSEPRPTRQPPTKWHPDEPDDASEAARWHGDNTDRQLTYRREYIPVASIGNDTTENWLQWYEDERREHDELRPGYFDQLEVAYHKTPEHLPLIAVVHGAKKYAESVQSDGNRYGLDDGAHRLAIAHKLGMTHVPAFVGYPKIKKSEEPATLVKNGTGSGGKGPKVHTVWRVEADDGSGPYENGDVPLVDDGHPARPASRTDFEPDVYRRMLTPEGQRTNKFGFLRPEHASAWFGSNLKTLQRRGYKVREYRARQVWPSKSGLQCWFEPHVEPVKKSEPSAPHLPQREQIAAMRAKVFPNPPKTYEEKQRCEEVSGCIATSPEYGGLGVEQVLGHYVGPEVGSPQYDAAGYPAGDPYGHSFNIHHDGTIIDATADQFGDEDPIRIVPVNDPRHAWYREEVAGEPNKLGIYPTRPVADRLKMKKSEEQPGAAGPVSSSCAIPAPAPSGSDWHQRSVPATLGYVQSLAD